MSSFDDHHESRIALSRWTAITGFSGLVVGFMLLVAACGSGAAEESLGSEESDPGNSSQSSGQASGDTESTGGNPDSATTTTADGSTDEDGGDTTNGDSTAGNTDDEDSDDGDSNGEGDAAERAEIEGYAQAFSSCMRNQGVDIPDLGINADGSLDIDTLVQNVDTQDPAVQQALLACRDSLGGKLEGALAQFLTSETFENVLIGFSDCVRHGGYAVKDLTLQAIIGAMLSGGPGSDPKGIDGSFAPIAANAMGLDSADPAVLNTIDDCAAGVQDGLTELNLGALAGDG